MRSIVDAMLGLSQRPGSWNTPRGITKETHFQQEMGFLFLMTFKIYFDKLEKNKKPITAKQFGFHAWTEPKDRVHEILPEGRNLFL